MMPSGAAAVGVLPPSWNSIPVILVSREATSKQLISLTLLALSLMMVAPIPAPCSVIALLIVKVVDHVNVPAGSVIVSPFNTAFCRPCTLATEPSEWYVVAPQRRAGKPVQIRINRTIFPDTFISAAYRSWRYAAVSRIRINPHRKENFCVGAIYFALGRTVREIRGSFDYAFQTFPGASGTSAIAFRVSTMHRAQAPSSR